MFRKYVFLSVVMVMILSLFACGGAAPAETSDLTTTTTESTSTTESKPAEQTEPTIYNLSTSVNPSEAGSVSPSDGEYESGESVALKAVPASGYEFERWSGDASGTSTTITVNMISNKNIVGHFSAVDTTPPTISGIDIIHITESVATINWITDEPATNQVRYGTTTTYSSTTPVKDEMDTSHSVTLTGLQSDTTYHIRLISKDEAGNETLSGDATFTTSNILELVTAIIEYPPFLFEGLVMINPDGSEEQITPDSYWLDIKLFNDSSKTIRIIKAEIFDGQGRRRVTITPSSDDGSIAQAGTTYASVGVFEDEPSDDWQVEFYYEDADGNELIVIGVCTYD